MSPLLVMLAWFGVIVALSYFSRGEGGGDHARVVARWGDELANIRALLEQERWQEALVRLDHMPVDVDAEVRAACENDRAWCLLQTGDVEAGLELASKLCASRSVGDGEATRAIGLVMAERPAEAVDALEYAAKVASSPRARAIRWYYLGEARRALARPDADEAYRRACEAEPGGPWAKRAELRVSDGSAYR